MTSSLLAKPFRSIRTRLLLVLACSGLAINALVLLALFAHWSITADAFRRSLAQYVHYLAEDIGSPPDKARAAEIAARTGMIISYLSPETRWSTSIYPHRFDPKRLRSVYNEGTVQIAVSHKRHYLIYREGEDRMLLFEVVRSPAGDHRLHGLGILLISLVSLLLVGASCWIRRIMAPLKVLTEGVQQLSLGRLEHRVAVDRTDELGDLARAFNTMGERLQQLIRTKEQMLRDVSHELRSPLTRMKVALEMAPEGNLKSSLVEDVVDMERMVTTLLESARAQSGTVPLRLEPTDLVPLIEELVAVRAHEPPGLRLAPLPETLPLLWVDPEKVRTVLRNVFDNALKYSRNSDGPVSVSVAPKILEGAPWVSVEVEDHGIGIPEEDLPFIFEPFYRVDPSRSRETGGFGLGLSLCKAVMDAHGGSISVESAPGKGTKVTLEFAAGERPSESRDQA